MGHATRRIRCTLAITLLCACACSAEPADTPDSGAAEAPDADTAAAEDGALSDAPDTGAADDAAQPSTDAAPRDAAAADGAGPPATADASTGAGSWSSASAMPTKRTEIAVAELDGKIYVAGGYGGTSAFEAYDPLAERWETLADMPMGHDHPSLAALNGLVYVTGGGASEMFSFDPGSGKWSAAAALLHSRYAAAAVALSGALYVIGGTGPSDTVIQRYDPGTKTWSERARLSMLRDHVAAVALAGKIYVLGGRPGRGNVYKSVEVYDPEQDRLEPGPDMLEGRSGFGAGVVDGKIYVAGGEVLIEPFSVRDTVEVLDPASGAWRFQAKLPMPLHGTGSVGFQGRFYLFGGVTMAASAAPRLGGVYVLTP